MTTVAQVRQALKPLLQRHSDLALAGRHLVLTPINHFTRGVYLARSGNPKIFAPTIDVGIIFMGIDRFHYGWGNTRLIHPIFSNLKGDTNERAQAIIKMDIKPFFGGWHFDNPENMEIMLSVIEDALVPLRKITKLEEVVEFASRNENNFTPFEFKYYARLMMATALGDFEEAIRIMDGPDYRQVELRKDMMYWNPTFYPALIAGDRRELAKILHELEAITIKSLKYRRYWEPTPFPLELKD